jgi:dienelactone hydrolase
MAKFWRRRWVRIGLRLGAASAVLGAVLLGALVGWLWVAHGRAVTLPAPAGPYAIGRTTYDWVDAARPDPFAPGTSRELLVWVWYPAAPTPGAPPALYMSPAWAKLRASGVGALLYQRPDRVRVHAVAEAPLAPAPARYPVLILEPGLGRDPIDYTTLAEDLASRGYIVAGIFPTDSTDVLFPDGRTVPSVNAARDGMAPDQLIGVWAGDVRFVLDQLTARNAAAGDRLAGHLDLDRLGIFGHSFGGATAAEVCRLDTRCKAGADLDGTPYGAVARTGLPQPFLFINGDEATTGACNADCVAQRQGTATIVGSAPTGHFALIVGGAHHFNFTDLAVTFFPLGRPLGLLGPIDGARGLRITAAYLAAFFDRYLQHAATPLLDGPSPAYPEVRFAAAGSR